MELKDRYLRHTYSYLALRKAVGWIGILLPFILIIGGLFLFNEDIQKSISSYYYTRMGNLFVGSICAIALFLFFYTGYDRWDNWLGNLTGFSGLGIAFFPATETGLNSLTGYVHLISAAIFFLALALFSLFLFTRKGSSPTPQKLVRNKIYTVCGLTIIVSMVAIIIYFILTSNNEPESTFVFWAETVALIAFGISWLVKGGTLYPDR